MEYQSTIKSVYIHIPFCSHICSYCDFSKVIYNGEIVDKYLDALTNEVNKSYNFNETIQTIYIGGGTPSSLNIKQLTKLFGITDKFKLDNNYEFTIECNIENINKEKLALFKQHHINRISVGIESFHQEKLDLLERKYKEIDIDKTINLIKNSGFKNINVDLMYATPNETLDNLKEEITRLIELDVPHISTYSLILEEHTKLSINNTKKIDEDQDRDMYDLIHEKLTSNGYIHYEISNFAKDGYESKHNLTYWRNEHYYGFGLGASGYIDNTRYTNTKNVNKYINGNYRDEESVLTTFEAESNQMILGLRTIYGVNKKDFHKRFNQKIEEIFPINKLKDNNTSYIVDYDNWYIMNEILIDFI